MRKSLHRKLTLAFVLVAFASVILVALFIRITSAYQLEKMVVDQQLRSLTNVLNAYYSRHHSWEGVAQDWERIHHLVSLTGPDMDDQTEAQTNQPHENMGEDDLFGLADSQGIVIVPVDLTYLQGSKLPETILQAGTPLMVSGQHVATILKSNRQPNLDTAESLFLQRTYYALMLAVIGALIVAFLVGKGLARTLISPLEALKTGVHNITQGQLEQQVNIASDDEIGQLADAFNRMSHEVARVNQSRRQMTADIAHDLNTPLTVISGYLEGLEDGTLRPTVQRFRVIRKEVERMKNMVGDLRTLSLADAGELHLSTQPESTWELLQQTAALFSQAAKQKDIRLLVDVQENLPAIQVDYDRMIQILSNLISNSLRYTPHSGTITLSARRADGALDLSVQDTGAGIDPEELPYIFDRFRRADKSRQSDGGQSGLGLAIVKALVDLHGGSAWVESILHKGTRVHILIPYINSEQETTPQS